MIGGVSKLRRAVVIATIAGTTGLTALGVLGGGVHPERYDQWQSVVGPAGADGVRVTDTFDQDFGTNDRRGHERYIPHDYGAPIDVVVSSPDAPDRLFVDDFGDQTRIRVGEPDVTISGQHRYTIAYTLPDAFVSGGVLSLDVLAPDDPEIDRFELIVTGFVLRDPVCLVGSSGSDEQCEVVESRDGWFRAVVEPVESGAGITVEGDIVDVVEPETVAAPPLPERRDDGGRWWKALTIGGLGAVGAGAVLQWARRRGRNEVFAGGAADAAFGSLPPPGVDVAPPPIELVADDRMDELATIEFVPPDGIEPWEASVLLRERVDTQTVEAWLSGLAGHEAIELAEAGDQLEISTGPRLDQLDERDAALLTRLLGGRDSYTTTGTYDSKFASAWSAISTAQRDRIAQSGWWKHLPPGSGLSPSRSGSPFGLITMGVFLFFMFGSAGASLVGAFRSWPWAIAIGLLVPAVVAFFMYRALLPARSAQGSALALRTESFRRFLHASEAQHVEWAWSQGLLREYSGWAVALGEADAWSSALDRANVPPPARAAAGPIIVHRRGSAIRTQRTQPQQSGGGSGGRGGGFRSGSVGGGGGGSSRGSW